MVTNSEARKRKEERESDIGPQLVSEILNGYDNYLKERSQQYILDQQVE